MKIAVVGAGVSGLTCAYRLADQHEVRVFEAADYAGGHTDTHQLTLDGTEFAVDSGFIVFNEHNYPNFTAMLRELGVSWINTDMSFSVSNELSGLEYGATGLARLFAQRRNLLSPRFYRMLGDIRRFYKEAPALLEQADENLTLGEYLQQEAYSQTFIHDHILPMACALWSAAPETIEAFPARYFVSFMANHRMLQITGRPQWLTVKGGSNRYVQAIASRLGKRLRTGCPVERVERHAAGAVVHTARYGAEHFDRVIFACHSDQALGLIDKPTPEEVQVLGAIPYQENTATVHTDTRLLPKTRGSWASWNAWIPRDGADRCTVSYWMNCLQDLPVEKPIVVSLNARHRVADDQVLVERVYHHPVYTRETLIAQKRRLEICGHNHSYFCGAYWGWGFHEDGVRSALDVVERLEEALYVAA